MTQTRQHEARVHGERDDQNPDKPVTFWTVVKSTLAAAIGVQSRRNRERDFEHGTPAAFITAGIIFTLGFIAVLVLVVRWVIGQAG